MEDSNLENVQSFMNSLPVLGEDGSLEEIRNSTCFVSDIAPLIYQDGRLIESNDYVIHIRFEEGIAVSAEFAQVWATLYYDNGQPIGVSLKPSNSNANPTIAMFTTTDDECNQKLYFRTAVTYNQRDTNQYILPLSYRGEELKKLNEDFCHTRLVELSKNNAMASFALALLNKNKNKNEYVDYMIQAANQGYGHAYTHLSGLFKQSDKSNETRWLDALKCGVEINDSRAKYELAMAHARGDQILQSNQLAVELLKDASVDIHLASLELGKYHRYDNFNSHINNRLEYDSRYFPPLEDAMKAIKYFDSLADEDWVDKTLAKFYLAECYEHGIGCDADLDISIQLYEDVKKSGKIEHLETQDALFRLAKFKIEEAERFTADGNVVLGRGMMSEATTNLKFIADLKYAPAQLYLAKEWLTGSRLDKQTELAYKLLASINHSDLSSADVNAVKKMILLQDSDKKDIQQHSPTVTNNKKEPVSKNIDNHIEDHFEFDVSLIFWFVSIIVLIFVLCLVLFKIL